MPVQQHRPSSSGPTNGGDGSVMIEKLEELAAAYGCAPVRPSPISTRRRPGSVVTSTPSSCRARSFSAASSSSRDGEPEAAAHARSLDARRSCSSRRSFPCCGHHIGRVRASRRGSRTTYRRGRVDRRRGRVPPARRHLMRDAKHEVRCGPRPAQPRLGDRQGEHEAAPAYEQPNAMPSTAIRSGRRSRRSEMPTKNGTVAMKMVERMSRSS